MTAPAPLIKWAGGKSRLAPTILDVFQAAGQTPSGYVEPFLGSGAAFFAALNAGMLSSLLVQPDRIVLGDANPALINFYAEVQLPGRLMQTLDQLPYHSAWRAHYNDIREAFNAAAPVGPEQAARFWWLNHACFNGLWRVNGSGRFNVPPGDYQRIPRPDRDAFVAVGRNLQGLRLVEARATTVLDQVLATGRARGAWAYLDPPYVPFDSGGFTDYTAGGFGEYDLWDLALRARDLAQAGATVVLSNHDVPLVRQAVEETGATEIRRLEVARSIGASGATRKRVGEVLVVWRPR